MHVCQAPFLLCYRVFSSLFPGVLVLLCWYFLTAITKVVDIAISICFCLCFLRFPLPPVHDVCKDCLFLFFVFCFSFFVFCTSHVYKHVCVCLLVCTWECIHTRLYSLCSYAIMSFVMLALTIVFVYISLFLFVWFFLHLFFVCANTSSPSPPRGNSFLSPFAQICRSPLSHKFVAHVHLFLLPKYAHTFCFFAGFSLCHCHLLVFRGFFVCCLPFHCFRGFCTLYFSVPFSFCACWWSFYDLFA